MYLTIVSIFVNIFFNVKLAENALSPRTNSYRSIFLESY